MAGSGAAAGAPAGRAGVNGADCIRIAHSSDAACVAGIVEAAYRPYVTRIGKQPGPMLDDYDALVAAECVWVLEQGGAIAGIIVLLETEAGLLLDNVAVRPELHGRGIGRALIGFAEAEARRRGHVAIRLYTHVLMTENIALYAHLGFAETGRVTEKGFDRVYMEKNLRLQISHR